MTRTLVRCSIIGGLIVFIWSVFSWMALPIHKNCFLKFKNEAEVADVIRHNATGDGMYILPNTLKFNDQTTQRDLNRGIRMLENGPFMFASVQIEGLGKMSLGPFVLSIVTQIAGAFVITWMLLQTKITDFKKKVGFVTLFGLAIAIISQIPDANWWGFAWGYTLVNCFDLIVGWFLAGLVIARFSTVK